MGPLAVTGGILIMSFRKELVQDALTLALLCLAVPAFCPAQVAARFALSPGAPAESITAVDPQEISSQEAAIVSEAPPIVALADALSQDAVLLGAPLSGAATQAERTTSGITPCLEPPPLLGWQDYQGPLQKVVGAFAGKLDLKSAHPPHYKPGTVLCSLEPKDKFMLFVRDSLHPISFLTSAFDAGLDQAANRDPAFGQGPQGYVKRFGADFAGQTTWRFFTDFAYPVIFAEDPRYYRLIHASGRRRFFHAVEHTFVAHRDSGKLMFNFSEWLGTATSVALDDLYHPGNERGLTPALRVSGYSLAGGMGFDVLREFWPDIARKLRMPFRDTHEPPLNENSRSPQ
jgi:hypothetical protein